MKSAFSEMDVIYKRESTWLDIEHRPLRDIRQASERDCVGCSWGMQELCEDVEKLINEFQYEEAVLKLNTLNGILNEVEEVSTEDSVIARRFWPLLNPVTSSSLLQPVLYMLISLVKKSPPGSLSFVTSESLIDVLKVYRTCDDSVRWSILALFKHGMMDFAQCDPAQVIDFLLISFPDRQETYKRSSTVKALLENLYQYCCSMGPEVVMLYLDGIFGKLQLYIHTDFRYHFGFDVSKVLMSIVSLGVDLFSSSKELFDHVVTALSDVRLQPWSINASILSTLLYHFENVEIVKRIPINSVLRILNISIHDDLDAVEILNLVANMVYCDRSVVSIMCNGDFLVAIGSLALGKKFKVRKSVMWLCWNLISFGSDEDLVQLFENNEVFSALKDSFEIEDAVFVKELIIPACLRLAKAVDGYLIVKTEELADAIAGVALDGNEEYEIVLAEFRKRV
jgi:hypothetical protein